MNTMSPAMAMTMPTAMYTPSFDTMDRHDYGIKKHRKSASAGGGRAWSEDEVCVYVVPNLYSDKYIQSGLMPEYIRSIPSTWLGLILTAII